MMKNFFIKGNYGMVGMPLFLLVALIISILIIVIFSASVYRTIEGSKIHEIKKELDKIITEAENLFEYADEGSLLTVHVEFSGSFKFVVFGSMPINGSLIPFNFTLDESVSNNFYFVTFDGTISSYESNARFSGKDVNEIAFFGPGSYDLNLELVKTEGKTYVKIY